ARHALRIRVSISAIGSVILIVLLYLVPSYPLLGRAGLLGYTARPCASPCSFRADQLLRAGPRACRSLLCAFLKRGQAGAPAPTTATLPTGLAHSRDEPGQRHVAERDTRESELTQVRARPSAELAAIADAHNRRVARHLANRGVGVCALIRCGRRVLDYRLQLATTRRVLRDDCTTLLVLLDLGSLRHCMLRLTVYDDGLLFTAERHAELAEKCKSLIVLVRRRDERDVHPVDLIYHVVVDFGEDHLLLDAHRVVAASVERARVEAAEITDAWNRDRHQTIEELPHARTTQRHRRADLLALALTEVRDRLLRLAPHGPLTGYERELVDHDVEHLGVANRFANTAVDHDLLDGRNLVQVAESVLLGETSPHRRLVMLTQTRRRNRQLCAGVFRRQQLLALCAATGRSLGRALG